MANYLYRFFYVPMVRLNSRLWQVNQRPIVWIAMVASILIVRMIWHGKRIRMLGECMVQRCTIRVWMVLIPLPRIHLPLYRISFITTNWQAMVWTSSWRRLVVEVSGTRFIVMSIPIIVIRVLVWMPIPWEQLLVLVLLPWSTVRNSYSQMFMRRFKL